MLTSLTLNCVVATEIVFFLFCFFNRKFIPVSQTNKFSFLSKAKKKRKKKAKNAKNAKKH